MDKNFSTNEVFYGTINTAMIILFTRSLCRQFVIYTLIMSTVCASSELGELACGEL